MSEPKRKTKPGSARTEVFAMRLDPKLKYLAEIAARKQRRSLANFMEWSIELGLKDTVLREYENHNDTVWDQSEALWDVDGADRLANLAFAAPDLMTYDEQVLWKLIRETGFIWKGKSDSDGSWAFDPSKRQSLIRERLREHWQAFNMVARGEAGKETLPAVANAKSGKTDTVTKADDFDDDIPF